MNIGQKIKELRVGNGWTLEELGKRATLSKSYVWEIEHGRCPRPSFDTIDSIAQAFGISVAELSGKGKPRIDASLAAAISSVRHLQEQAYERGYRDGLAKGKSDGS